MIDQSKLLIGVPVGLRDPILASFREISANYLEHRWEPSELNGGKFCEVVYTILDGAISGTYAATPSKPADMVQACRALEKIPPNPTRKGDRSLRILIPRMLQPLYEVRNNRGVGHVGGDVDPNYMDASTVFEMASWILAELIRIFHGVSTEQAQSAVDALIERKHPLVWEIEGIKRVLDPKMQKRDQVLVLLYQRPAWVSEKDLLAWVEYSSAGMFPRRVLKPLHDERLIEYDAERSRARISPVGAKEVEQRLLKTR